MIPNRQLASGDSKKSWLRMSLAATFLGGGGGVSDSAVVVASNSVVVVDVSGGAAFLFRRLLVVMVVLPNCPSVNLPRLGSCSAGRLIHRFAFFRGRRSCCSASSASTGGGGGVDAVVDGKSVVVLFVAVAALV